MLRNICTVVVEVAAAAVLVSACRGKVYGPEYNFIACSFGRSHVFERSFVVGYTTARYELLTSALCDDVLDRPRAVTALLGDACAVVTAFVRPTYELYTLCLGRYFSLLYNFFFFRVFPNDLYRF